MAVIQSEDTVTLQTSACKCLHWLVSFLTYSFILYNIYFHAGVTLDGLGHSVISVFLPQDAVSLGMELIVSVLCIVKWNI